MEELEEAGRRGTPISDAVMAEIGRLRPESEELRMVSDETTTPMISSNAREEEEATSRPDSSRGVLSRSGRMSAERPDCRPRLYSPQSGAFVDLLSTALRGGGGVRRPQHQGREREAERRRRIR
ncbi:hypothetical protein TYRP_023776, partial [Tyrophagus putrescentiae]